MSQFLPAIGINGEVMYSGQTFRITNGTFTISDMIGIIDSDLNYRLSNKTKGNLMTTSGITRVVINGVVIDINPIGPVVTSFTASPVSITSGQSSTLTWASTNAD